MRYPILFLAFALSLLPLAVSARSPANTDAIVAQVGEYYGAEALLAAQTIRLEEDIRTFYDGYSYGTDFHDLTAQKRHFILAPKDQEGSAEYLTQIGSNTFHARAVLMNGAGLMVDYGNETYQLLGRQEFYAQFGSVIRSSDLLLARELIARPENATLGGREMWLGRWHRRVHLSDAQGGPELIIFVNEQTGRISRMHRVLGSGLQVSYTFDRPVSRDGLRFASEQSVFAGDRLLYLSIDRHYAINAPGDMLAIGADPFVVAEPARSPTSEPSVEEVAKDVFHVGQNEAYSTIFIRPDGFVVFGTRAGLDNRIALFRQRTANDQPVLAYVTADHHAVELAGIPDAVADQAPIYITAPSLAELETQYPGYIESGKLIAVEDRIEIAGVQVLAFSTSHAAKVLAVLSPDGETISQVYHYANPYRDAPFFVMDVAVTFADALRARAVSPRILLSGSGRNPVAWREFEAALAKGVPQVCRRNRPICQGWKVR